MRYCYLLLTGFAGLIFLIPGVASAEPTTHGPVIHRERGVKPPARRRMQRIIFDDDTVTAGRYSGVNDVITLRRSSLMQSMVTIRPDFIPELIKSAEDI